MFENTEYEPSDADRATLARERFLTSHRAIAACSREFTAFAQEVADRARALRQALMIEEEPELRLTPDRCIVQLGPIAITVAWLRGPLDSLTDGRLLIIAWRGTIARRRFREVPTRRSAPVAEQTAVSIWEETFIPSADEHRWEWECESDPSRRYDSTQLAIRCIEQLSAAWSLQAAS